MGQADGEGIRGVGIGCFGEAEEDADHEADLAFIRGAAADDGLFYAPRGVLEDGQTGGGGGEERGAAGATEGNGGPVTLDVDHGLDGGALRRVLPDQIGDLFVDRNQAARGQEFGGVFDRAVFERARTLPAIRSSMA